MYILCFLGLKAYNNLTIYSFYVDYLSAEKEKTQKDPRIFIEKENTGRKARSQQEKIKGTEKTNSVIPPLAYVAESAPTEKRK